MTNIDPSKQAAVFIGAKKYPNESRDTQKSDQSNLADNKPGFFRPGAPRPVNNWLLVAGLLGMFAAATLEHPRITASLQTNGEIVFDPAILITFIMELGFAFFIAWIVSNGVELASRQRDAAAAQQMRDDISEHVMQAVLKLTHEKDYVVKVLNVALRPELWRESIEVAYTIRAVDPELANSLGAEQDRFVLLDILTAYKLRNIGAVAREFPLKCRYSVRSGALRQVAKITKLEVTVEGIEKKFTPDEIQDATSDYGNFYRVCEWSVVLPPGGTATVAVDNTLIKEKSDNEIWGSLHPTGRLTMTLRSALPKLVMGARALTATAITEKSISPDGQFGSWEINGPILPNDSVVVWWRTEADDGVPPLASPSPAIPSSGVAAAPPPLGGGAQEVAPTEHQPDPELDSEGRPANSGGGPTDLLTGRGPKDET